MALVNRTGLLDTPYASLLLRVSTEQTDYTNHGDDYYNSLVSQLHDATTIEEAQQLATAADKYALEQCWSINICQKSGSVLWQPYVKGYSGEIVSPHYGFYYARWWQDQDLKTSLGY
jgi:ABC-type transport system substrate-binding protein